MIRMVPTAIDYSIYNWFVDVSKTSGYYGRIFKVQSIIESNRLIKTSYGYHDVIQAKLFEELEEAIRYSKRLKKMKVLK